MTYECFLMWCLKEGLETVLSLEDAKFVLLTLKSHFEKHTCYDPNAFEKIWIKMQEVMPQALSLKGKETGTVYPLFHMMKAAELAGFQVPFPFDVGFGFHIVTKIGQLRAAGRDFALVK